MNTLESGKRPHRLLGIGASVIEESLRELGLLNLEKRRLRGIFSMRMITWQEEWRRENRLSSAVLSDGTRGNGYKLKYRKFCLNIRKPLFYHDDNWTLEWVNRRCCGVSKLRNIPDPLGLEQPEDSSSLTDSGTNLGRKVPTSLKKIAGLHIYSYAHGNVSDEAQLMSTERLHSGLLTTRVLCVQTLFSYINRSSFKWCQWQVDSLLMKLWSIESFPHLACCTHTDTQASFFIACILCFLPHAEWEFDIIKEKKCF